MYKTRAEPSNDAAGDSADSQAESGGESEGEPAPRMRVGQEYQADIPEQVGDVDESLDESRVQPVSAMRVWSPAEAIGEAELESFVQLAKEKYNYSLEQAMGMLYWHKYDLNAAREDLCNFTPFPDEWSLEDKVIFEQAFQSHGKSFRRIRSMLPDKSVGSLVKYYYSWKKTRCRTSHIDRQARRLARAQDESDSDGDQASHSNSDSDFEPGKAFGRHGDRRRGHSGGNDDVPQSKRRVKLPKGMYLDKAALLEIARTGNEDTMDRLNAESAVLRRSIQQNKQQLSQSEEILQHRAIEQLRPPDIQRRLVSRWTDDELQMAVEALRRYGKDFHAIANVVGNKSVHQCRNFYMNYKRRFHLDSVLDEFEASQAAERVRNGVSADASQEDEDGEEADEMTLQETPLEEGGQEDDVDEQPSQAEGQPVASDVAVTE